MASEGKRIQSKAPKRGVCWISINMCPPETRQPEGARRGTRQVPSAPHPCPASTKLQERWTQSGRAGEMTGCSREAFVPAHANLSGTASGWFQRPVTQDSAGLAPPGCSTPSTPAREGQGAGLQGPGLKPLPLEFPSRVD